ncbi:guanine nucleotide-binding protein G(I)/G(S)/G(O) subunit gamma-4 isoform 1-T1 [Leptodactylus fuscus]|uniref:guanine nucleotide-binding protein G(I)/G(S)/G(O) subunit gamma-4 isoform X1 n=1 Tax=Leptodactylus fuscus TaxID=238119 RepID=UPI003F4F247F
MEEAWATENRVSIVNQLAAVKPQPGSGSAAIESLAALLLLFGAPSLQFLPATAPPCFRPLVLSGLIIISKEEEALALLLECGHLDP